MPKVSIIMPIHNGEKEVARAINSVINQTLTDIEILLVNDDSTDGTQKILEDFSKKDSRIKLFYRKHTRQESWGYTHAVNLALQHATGDYILIPDHDDYLELDALKKLYSKTEDGTIDAVKGCMRIETNGNFTNFSYIPNGITYFPKWTDIADVNLLYLHLCPLTPQLQTIMTKRDLLVKIPLCTRCYMDTSTSFKIKILAQDFVYIDDLIYTAVADNTDSVTRKKGNADKFCFDIFAVFDELDWFLKEYQIDSKIWFFYNALKFTVCANLTSPLSPIYYNKYLEYLQRDFVASHFDVNIFKSSTQLQTFYNEINSYPSFIYPQTFN